MSKCPRHLVTEIALGLSIAAVLPVGVVTRAAEAVWGQSSEMLRIQFARVAEHERDMPLPEKRAPTEQLRWVRTGGPLGGIGYDVRMRPGNPDIMYATDAFSGVNVSTDGGRTWRPSNNGILTRAGPSGDAIPVFCLTIDPHNPDVIWAGTQNRRGIFKSTDGGKNWTEQDNGVIEREGITFRGFAIDPRHSDIVYAAAEISSFVWAGRERQGREFDLTRGVVYKTTNGGEHWRAIWRGDNLARYVCINPQDPNVIYVSTGIFDREAANSNHRLNQSGGVGILKTVDGGRTWRALGQAHGLTNLYIGSLFMHPKDPDILLAGAGNNAYPDGCGVFLSTDGGEKWRKTLRGPNINSIEFCSSDPRIAYAAGGSAFYRSSDGGYTWRQVSQQDPWGPPGIPAGFPIDIQVHPHNADLIFANNYLGGNFLSEDGGRTWQAASRGYTGAQVRDIAICRASGRVFAAARSGLFVGTDGGRQWIGLCKPPISQSEWYAVAADPSDPHHILAANNWEGAIVQSRAEGRQWHRVSERPGPRISWRAIAFAPSDPEIVYAGTSAFFSAGTFDDHIPARGIYMSDDGGNTWREANDARSRTANVAAIGVAPDNPKVVYAATCNKGLLKSVDGGRRWQPSVIGDEVRDVRSVAIHPSNARTLYAGVEAGGVWRSTNRGASWRHCSSGMDPEASIRDIVVDPTNPGMLYAADIHSGVYRSDNAGTLWVRVNTALRTRAVNGLAISADGRTLYAATEGEGVFRLDIRRD